MNERESLLALDAEISLFHTTARAVQETHTRVCGSNALASIHPHKADMRVGYESHYT